MVRIRRQAKINIKVDSKTHEISKYLYGSFAEHLGRCIYPGIWVGENSKVENDDGIRVDVVESLRKLNLPVLRWPGGCFADSYHWDDGIGPRKNRPKRYNLPWNQPESNEFGTDEFIRFCRLIGTEPYICVNVGSGSPQEAMNWLEYCNTTEDTYYTNLRVRNGSKEPYSVRFWGIGNENWGCGGRMRPEYYADLYRRFAAYMHQRGKMGINLIACGSGEGILEWDEVFLDRMEGALDLVNYLAIHYYTRGKGDVHFSDEEYYAVINSIHRMKKYLCKVVELLESYSSRGHEIDLIMDEWGTWYSNATVEAGLYQQNTLRDALFTAASFHMFHEIGSRFFMANMAQTINVLQAFLLTKGRQMILTPTYHVYDMYHTHKGATKVRTDIDCPEIGPQNSKSFPSLSVSSSVSDKGKQLFITLVNLDLTRNIDVQFKITGAQKTKPIEAKCLTASKIQECNTFEQPNLVSPTDLALKPNKTSFEMTIPPKSINTFLFQLYDGLNPQK